MSPYAQRPCLTLRIQIESASHLNKVVFRDMASASASSRFLSLFPGLGYAAAYKVDEILKNMGEP